MSEKTVSNDQSKQKPSFNYTPIKSETSDPDASNKFEMVNNLIIQYWLVFKLIRSKIKQILFFCIDKWKH